MVAQNYDEEKTYRTHYVLHCYCYAFGQLNEPLVIKPLKDNGFFLSESEMPEKAAEFSR